MTGSVVAKPDAMRGPATRGEQVGGARSAEVVLFLAGGAEALAW
jgi:hypothetical protein